MEGLPKPLEAVLNSFLDSLELKSWQIYSEGNGACMKIRFKPKVSSENVTVEQCGKGKWKKASPSQLKRDGARAQRHAMTLRSKSCDQPEQPRYVDNNEPELEMSAITIKSDCTERSNCTQSDIDFSPVSNSHSQIRPLPSEPCMDEQLEDYIPSPLSEIGEDSESDSGSWCIDTDERYKENACLHRRCQYFDFGEEDMSTVLYECLKSGCENRHICETCVRNGGHRGHKKYIRPVEDTG